MSKYHYLEVADGDSISDTAALLVAVAQAEGLPLPTTDTGSTRVRFVVTDELLNAYQGIGHEEPSDTDLGASEDTTGKKSRKKKGN